MLPALGQKGKTQDGDVRAAMTAGRLQAKFDYEFVEAGQGGLGWKGEGEHGVAAGGEGRFAQ